MRWAKSNGFLGWMDCAVWVSPLGPLWSLAIEEQFYVAWSLIARFFRGRAMLTIAATVWIANIALRFYLATKFDQQGIRLNTLYFFTFTHLDGLCAGIIVRILYEDGAYQRTLLRFSRSWWVWLLLLIAILLIDHHLAPATVVAYRPVMLRLGLTIDVLFYAGIMLRALLAAGTVRHIFENKFLKKLGDWSYFIYLFHIGVAMAVSFALQRFVGQVAVVPRIALEITATIALAGLSNRFFDGPLRKLKRYFVPAY